MAHLGRGFVVQDRNYLSARWPGDAYSFALKYIEMLARPLANSLRSKLAYLVQAKQVAVLITC